MLSQQDLELIEKFLACEFNLPDAMPLTKEEQILWNERMNDSDFTSQLQLERGLHEDLSKQPADEIALREKLKTIYSGKISSLKRVQQCSHWDFLSVESHSWYRELRLSGFKMQPQYLGSLLVSSFFSMRIA